MLRGRSVSVAIERDVMLPGTGPQTLKEAVEIVDDAGVVAVDIDLGFFGSHIEPNRGTRIDVVSIDRRIRGRVPDLRFTRRRPGDREKRSDRDDRPEPFVDSHVRHLWQTLALLVEQPGCQRRAEQPSEVNG